MTDELPGELWGPEPDPAGQAHARQVAIAATRAQHAEVVAASMSVEQAAAHSGLTEAHLHGLIDTGELLAVRAPTDSGTPLVPSWQLRADGIIPGIAELARAFGTNTIALTTWVTRPSPEFGGRTPAQALAEGEIKHVTETARFLSAAGW